MRCRNTNPECNASFCISCCKRYVLPISPTIIAKTFRYSYFDFDPDSRSFICPLCKNICNCSNCIRKRDLSHLLEVNGLRTESLTRKLKRTGVEGTVETYLQAMAEKDKQAPFDCVRLVCQEEDIISLELPPEPVEVVVKPKKMKAKKSKKNKDLMAGVQGQALGGTKKKSLKKSSAKNGNGKKANRPVILKFQIPPKTAPPRPKEVDSDGDTVGGYSDMDQDDLQDRSRSPGAESSLSSAPSTLSVTPPRRLAFPPRPPPSHHDSTTSLARVMNVDPGYIRPEMMQVPAPAQMVSSPREDVIRVNKLKKPPPAASIVRAPSYMSKPHLGRPSLRSQNATASSSSSSITSSSVPSEEMQQTWHDSAIGLHHPNSTVELGSGLASTPQTSSPDPLLLPLPTVDPNKQQERRIADDIFLNNFPRQQQRKGSSDEDDSPPIRLAPLPPQSRSQGDLDRDRDPLFPDAPLWYTYNQHNQHTSPPTRGNQ
jgi:hypothetical protein